jgi:hypothetical protein
MTVLLALVLGAGLLFAWLCDHWFARVLTFLVLFVPCWFTILAMIRGFNSTDGRGLVALFAGGGVAWGISWLPHLYYAARARAMESATATRH